MSDKHPPAPPGERIMRHFRYAHLPERLQRVSRPFAELAERALELCPRSAERTAGLRKLLEAKDCMVRAALEEEPLPDTEQKPGVAVIHWDPTGKFAPVCGGAMRPGEGGSGGRDLVTCPDCRQRFDRPAVHLVHFEDFRAPACGRELGDREILSSARGNVTCRDCRQLLDTSPDGRRRG